MRALKPVSVNGIEFDALMSEERSLEATVPEYPVESGFTVSDAVIHKSEKLSMVLFVSETPVTWKKRHGTGRARVNRVCQKIESLYFSGELVTIVTMDRVYTNMAIESVSFAKSVEVGYAREIPITFRKIQVSTSQTTTIPDSYGKSGNSYAAAGTASTTTGNGGSSSTSESDGTKSSILYSLANNIGLLPSDQSSGGTKSSGSSSRSSVTGLNINFLS